MTERWRAYFEADEKKHHDVLETAVEHWTYHQALYGNIRALVQPRGRILDIGCGLGFSDFYLQACGYDVVGVDNDPAIVEKAAAYGKLFNSSARFEVADAFDLAQHHGKFDLAYSVGVVEHFDRDVTVQLLREQARCARIVLTVIPTRFIKYSEGHTDERLYNMGGLQQMVTDAGMQPMRSFGYGDLPTPLHLLVKRLIPYGLYRFLQNRFTYALGIACAGATGFNVQR